MSQVTGRCPICGITWTPADVALWCKQPGCPKTEQRNPTDQQIEKFRIDEPFRVQK
jgi:hypothetical protein